MRLYVIKPAACIDPAAVGLPGVMLRHTRLGLLLVASLLCAACVRSPVKPVEWPDKLPSLEYYKNVYEQDHRNQELQSMEKYLTWVMRFYEGWDLYQDGWHVTSRDILLGIEDDEARDRVKSKLFQLGKLISAEWAKEIPERVVQTRELSIWGRALLKSLDSKRQEQLVDRVSRDVNALRAGTLERTDINMERYVEVPAGTVDDDGS